MVSDRFFFLQGDYMRCERLFKTVLSHELSSGTAEDDNKVVSISLKLASALARSGGARDAEAEIGFRFCVEQQQKKVENGEIYVLT